MASVRSNFHGRSNPPGLTKASYSTDAETLQRFRPIAAYGVATAATGRASTFPFNTRLTAFR